MMQKLKAKPIVLVVLVFVLSPFVLWLGSPLLAIGYEKVYIKSLEIEKAPTLTEMPELAREYINIPPEAEVLSDGKIINGKLVPPREISAHWITVFEDGVKSKNTVLLYPRFNNIANNANEAFLEFTYRLNIWDKQYLEEEERYEEYYERFYQQILQVSYDSKTYLKYIVKDERALGLIEGKAWDLKSPSYWCDFRPTSPCSPEESYGDGVTIGWDVDSTQGPWQVTWYITNPLEIENSRVGLPIDYDYQQSTRPSFISKYILLPLYITACTSQLYFWDRFNIDIINCDH